MSDNPISWPWSTLGVDAPLEAAKDVRRAYSRQLKTGKWDNDIDGFEELRRAYEFALELTGQGRKVRDVVTDLPPMPPLEKRPKRPPVSGKVDIVDIPEPEPFLKADTNFSDRLPSEQSPASVPILDSKPQPEKSDAKTQDIPDLLSPSKKTLSVDYSVDYNKFPVGEDDIPPDPLPTDPSLAKSATLLDQVHQNLLNKDFSIESWQEILKSTLLDDSSIRFSVESELVEFIAATNRYELPVEWARLIDARFGWHDDGIGFLRRHPDGTAALQNIVFRVNGGPSRKVKRVLKWLFWLIVLTIAARVLLRYFERNDIIAPGQFNDWFYAAIFPSIISGIRLAIMWWLVEKIANFLARFSPRLRRFLGRLRRNWQAPLMGINRTILTYFLVMGVPFYYLAPEYLGPAARPAISAKELETFSEGLYDRFYLKPWMSASRMGSVKTLPFPRFFVPLKETNLTGPESDPFDSASLSGLDREREPGLSNQYPSAIGPRALFECKPTSNAPAACRLAMRADLISIRITKWPKGRMSQLLAMPILQLSGDEGGSTILANWGNPIYTGINLIKLLPKKDTLKALDVTMAPVVTQMFLASLEYQGGVQAVQPLDELARPIILPADVLKHPISFGFSWPDDMKDSVKCVGGGSLQGRDVRVECGPSDVETLQYATWVCPRNSSPKNCEISPLFDESSTPPIKAVHVKERTITAKYEDPAMLLLQNLLLRMTKPGPYPQLAETPAVNTLRNAVLNDYALILDRPEATEYRLDKTAILSALTRQPHLYWTYRASKEDRDLVWQNLRTQMETIGFF